MRHPATLLLIVIALSACSRPTEPPVGGLQDKLSAGAPAPSSSPLPKEEKAGEQRTKYLAYEHALQVNVAQSRMAAAYEAAQAACAAAAAEQCVVLRASFASGPPAYASLQMRAKPAGIGKLTALLGAQGDIVSQSMNAEDLGGPIEDADKKLAMLKDYRERLEELRGRAASGIDSLIRINQELAQVQSQIEAQTGAAAQLMRRVDTELLNIEIHSKAEQSFWRPVISALSGFAATLAGGTSAAINTVAYTLPFCVVLLGLGWLLRRLWPRRRDRTP